MARSVALAIVAGLGILVAVLWGLSALAIYVVLALLLLGGIYVLGYFGDWIRQTSRGRFDDDRRRR
jgi:hypothetical protein